LPENHYDVVIIGSGPAATQQQFAPSIWIENRSSRKGFILAGIACMWAASHQSSTFQCGALGPLKDAAEFGIEADGRKAELGCDPGKKVEDRLQTCQGPRIPDEKKQGQRRVKGYGKLTAGAERNHHGRGGENDGKTSQLKARTWLAGHWLRSALPAGLEVDDRILTNIEILSLKEIPKSLIIVGAGAVGVEFASIYRSFGCEVTIVEMLPRPCSRGRRRISKNCPRLPQAWESTSILREG